MIIRIDKGRMLNYVIILFITLPFLDIVSMTRAGLTSLAFIDNYNKAGKLLALGVLLIFFIAFSKKVKFEFDGYWIPVLFLYIYITLRSFLAYGFSVTSRYWNLIAVPIFCLFFFCLFSMYSGGISLFTNILNVFMLVNLISIIRFVKQGGMHLYVIDLRREMGSFYFLGYDNGFILILLPAFCLNLILAIKKNNIFYLVMAILCLVSEVMVGSACSLSAFVILMMLLLVSKTFLYTNVIKKPWLIIISVAIAFIVFVWLHSMYFNDWFDFLFNKNFMVSRWRLWKDGISKLEGHVLFGYGYKTLRYGRGYDSSHNMILDFLLQGGIVELAFYLYLFHATLKKLSMQRSIESCIFFNAIVGFMAAYMAEGYNNYRSFWIFVVFMMIGNGIDKWEIC